MVTVDERGFDRERFWGPNTIKPLSFNYDFTPNFAGQNIWTLTDGLFLSDRRRLSEDLGGQEALKVIFSRAKERRATSPTRKRSSRYRQFPSIDQNARQKSTPPAPQSSAKVKTSASISGPNSRSSRIFSSRGSLSSRPTPPLDPTDHRKPQKVFSLTKHELRSDRKDSSGSKNNSNGAFKRKVFPKNPTQGHDKPLNQNGVSAKLSLEETERLLKSLDFRVRTRKKATTRERSKSERVRKPLHMSAKSSWPTAKMPFQKREIVVSPGKKERSGGAKVVGKNEKTVRTAENQLVKSSRQTSSSESSRKKSESSTSGLGDLLGPLPRVKWTPELPPPKERPSRKKASDKSSVTLMKANKMKTALKKVAEKDSSSVSQDLSVTGGSTPEAVVVRKVKTTPVKIIPKVTINNQLLKATTSKNEKSQEKKFSSKATPKTTVIKKGVAANSSSTLWTPEKVALLDQITSDQQLKAALMSAGDAYMKSRKYLSFKLFPRPVKPPTKAAQMLKSKETQTEGLKTATAQKTAGRPQTTSSKPSASVQPSGSSGKGDPSTSSVEVTDQPSDSGATDGAVDAEARDDDKTAGAAKKPATAGLKKPVAKPKPVYGTRVVPKPTVVVKNKPTKAPMKTGAGGHLAAGKKDASAAVKRRPKFVTTTKAKERLTQLTAEAAGPARIQSERMAQIRRTNLDSLKKILDKSLNTQAKPAKTEEAKITKID